MNVRMASGTVVYSALVAVVVPFGRPQGAVWIGAGAAVVLLGVASLTTQRAMMAATAFLSQLVGYASGGADGLPSPWKGRRGVPSTAMTVVESLAGLSDASLGDPPDDQRMSYIAQHDELTGLLNRQGLFKTIEAEILASDPIGIVHLDIDQFKAVNDTYGQAVGDEVLIHLAAKLNGAARSDDIVARTGDDEFVIVVRTPSAGLARLADRISRLAVHSASGDGGPIAGYRASVGWSFGRGKEASDVFHQANVATREAKSRGRTQQHYTDALAVRHENRRATQLHLPQALVRDDLQLFGQRIVDARSGATWSTEVLVRWHPEGCGAIGPSVFVPVAEQSDLIYEVDRWVLTRTVELLAEHGSSMGLSVNVSGKTLVTPSFPAFVGELTCRHGVQPSQILLEVTETHSALNSEDAVVATRELAERGIATALDDFGTGYSSLSNLLRLSVSSVKLDASFASNLCGTHGYKLVGSILDMTQKLDLDVIVEGVETSRQASTLLSLGSSIHQGHYYGKPEPLERLV